jgi:hypothetical protein
MYANLIGINYSNKYIYCKNNIEYAKTKLQGKIQQEAHMPQISPEKIKTEMNRFRFMVFNATFNNISVISWRSVLSVEETSVPREK